jgi:hypothetical protein
MSFWRRFPQRPRCGPWRLRSKVQFGFVLVCFVLFSEIMAYFSPPSQSVPIRIVNPAARVASPADASSSSSTHPVHPNPDGRETPKAVIGSVSPIFALQTSNSVVSQTCPSGCVAIYSFMGTQPGFPLGSPFTLPLVSSCKFEGKGCEFFHPPVRPPPRLQLYHSTPPLA